jgi:glycosyltransferase involved in cell wall biosynthesis
MFYYFNGQDILTYKIPYFYNIWDLGHLFINSFPEISSDIERRFNAEIDAKRASYILTESNAGRNDVSFSYNINLKKIGVLPMYGNIYKNNIDALDFENMLNENNYLKDNYLFYPAQFWPHKNHYNLLLALNKLKNEGNDTKIVFTGSDKGNLSYIKNLVIELGLQKNVLFLGFITDDEIQYLYRNAFALIMPTYLGPTNMPIIEAMQNNCLVLCSNLDGHIEQTNGQAIYFDPYNYNDIANQIQLAYTNVNGKNAEIVKNAYLYSININIENTCIKLNEYLDIFHSTRFCWSNSMRN